MYRLIYIVPINWRMATGKSLDSISRCLTIMISQCSKKQCPFAIGLFACPHHASLAKNGVLRYMHATGANSSLRADIHWLYVSGKVTPTPTPSLSSSSSSSSVTKGKGKDRSSSYSKQYYDVHLYNKPLWFHPSYSNALLSDVMSFNPTNFVNARNVFDKSSSSSNDASVASIHGSSSFSSSTIMTKINVHSSDINQLITKMLSQNQHLSTPNTEVTDVSSGRNNLKYLTNYYLSSNSKEIEVRQIDVLYISVKVYLFVEFFMSVELYMPIDIYYYLSSL